MRERCELLQLLTEIREAGVWLSERRNALTAGEAGRDEESVLALMRRLDAQQRELNAFLPTLTRLERTLQVRNDLNVEDRIVGPLEPDFIRLKRVHYYFFITF